jgi:transposase
VRRIERIELITGTGRRRRWSADDKTRIVVESLKPGASVSEVARRHGLSPQQLFGWRRQARHALGSAPAGRGSLEPSDVQEGLLHEPSFARMTYAVEE